MSFCIGSLKQLIYNPSYIFG
uniref:Uncharacterized protein n=1 Tax=Arundo donax TaxID=35708 RepID=A0A0A8Y4E5_ARUDO